MTMRNRAWFAVAMLGALALTASAQTRPRHEAFNGALGIGFGKLRTACAGCAQANDGAFQFTARGGWTMTDAFIVSGDFVVFQKHVQDDRGNDANTNYYAFTADVLWYPSKRWEIFFKGGGGVSSTSLSLDTPVGARHVKASAPLLRIGMGTDMRLGRSWALTPYVDYLLGLDATTNISGVKIKSSILLFGAAVTWP
jgi:hypothetical protein